MINFNWVSKSSISKDELNSYCESQKEVEFCWWVKGDAQGSDWVVDEVRNLINKAKENIFDTWGGNSHSLTSSVGKIVLEQAIQGISVEYSLEEFEEYFLTWRTECENSKIPFQ